MLVLPGKEYFMRLIEIQVVEKAKALIERGARNRHIRGEGWNYDCGQAHCPG
jgi:hypothetical protein